MLAYSYGSVIADGVEGSAAAIVYVGGTDIMAIVWLAAADKPLSSGREKACFIFFEKIRPYVPGKPGKKVYCRGRGFRPPHPLGATVRGG